MLIFFYSSSLPPYCTTLCSILDNKTSFKLLHRHKTTYASQSHPFPLSSPPSFSFPFHLSSHSWTTLTSTKPLPRGSRAYFLSSILALFLLLTSPPFDPYHRHPRSP